MKKPLVFINTVMSVDGKISTIERRQIKISNELDKERVDRLRAESDAVLVGMNTVVSDDPKLTVKSENLRKKRIRKGMPENPIKVTVGNLNRMKLNSDFLNYGNVEKIIFTTKKSIRHQRCRSFEDKVLKSKKDKIEKIKKKATVYILGEKKVNLRRMMEILYKKGVRRLMVEGGGRINFELLKEKLVNEIYVAIAPKIFGGKNAPTLADGEGFKSNEILNLEFLGFEKLEDVVVLKYKFNQ